nr:RNA-directed DNA polymerase, eukaryota [Tanacetum cinerariifolium]
MASMNTRLNIEKLDGNIVQKHGVAQRKLKVKQLEGKTNTDCLVNKHVHHSANVEAIIIKTRVPGQKGVEGNAAKRYRGDNNMAALGVAAVIEEYAHESLTFRDAVACERYEKGGIVAIVEGEAFGALGLRGGFLDSDEIRYAVWACGENKSPRPDGFTFELFVDFGILSSVLDGLISEVQSAFLQNRQILDGPFIINEILSWCKQKSHQAMIFKLDFAKAYDSVRWDFLEEVLIAFGFGPKWCSWILGSLKFGKASVLVNGSPTSEFQFHCRLKQGDPLAPYLFILIMESLHLSFARIVEAGTFKGLKLNNSVTISHLFYADDAVFVGDWSNSIIFDAATSLGCSIMKTPFTYLGVPIGSNMTNIKAWDDIIKKIKSRLSKWKVKTLSVGGRLTLLKSVLGATPIYWMSIYKVPKAVLASMETCRRKFFTRTCDNEEKISWDHALSHASPWTSIIREVQVLKNRAVDLVAFCQKRVGNGLQTSFGRKSGLVTCAFARCSLEFLLWRMISLARSSYRSLVGSKLVSDWFLCGMVIVVQRYSNKLLFDSRKPRKNVIFDDIVARSFAWCNARFLAVNKKCVVPNIEVSNSNPFEVLNSVDNDMELGTNRGTTDLVNNGATSSGSSFMSVDNSSTNTTPIKDKIRKFEELL